jgi:quercetin dioxygenase-like cupin family protein
LIPLSIRSCTLLALAAFLVGPSALAADGPSQGPYGSVKELLRTGTSTIGEPLRYPAGAPSVRTVVVTLAPGETTAKHHHDVPVFIYMLEGEVSVDYEGHGKKVYRAGDAFMEAMAAPHAATNVGKTQVRILATFLETAPAPGR